VADIIVGAVYSAFLLLPAPLGYFIFRKMERRECVLCGTPYLEGQYFVPFNLNRSFLFPVRFFEVRCCHRHTGNAGLLAILMWTCFFGYGAFAVFTVLKVGMLVW
jgi:hypothetical protein